MKSDLPTSLVPCTARPQILADIYVPHFFELEVLIDCVRLCDLQAAENSAVRETLEALESARVAEVEVLGQAWDLLAKLGAKRPSEGPGSQPEEPKQD